MPSQRRFEPKGSGVASGVGGSRSAYVYDDDVILAVNVALATHRPLVIGGPPGCGKSSLGLDVAYNLRWRYYLELISASTRALDLCCAAGAAPDTGRPGGGQSEGTDIVPGVLWWALDPVSALTRGGADGSGDRAQRAGIYPEGSDDAPAVVLLDEIDAAPDEVPLGLIEVLAAGGFTVPERQLRVQVREQPLVIATTNGHRPLPAAFTDLCVVLDLSAPTAEKLVRIGSAHFPNAPLSALREAADALIQVAETRNAPASAREYVNLVGSQLDLGVELHESPAWNEVIRSSARTPRAQIRRAAPVVRDATVHPAGTPDTMPAAPGSGAPAKAADAVRIFISYAREDATFARRVFDDLAGRGHAPWLDEELLLPGQNWRMAIEQAIRESALFLALLSARSVSKAGYVQKEMRQALDVLEEMPPGSVYVVPTRIELCEPSHAVLRDLHWVDLFPSYEDGFSRILQVIDLVPRQLKTH